MNVLEVKREQLEEQIAEVVAWDYVPKDKNENVFIAYAWGEIPVKVKSHLTQQEFARLCGDDVY